MSVRVPLQFVQAAGTRYSGTYDPTLGRSVANDPNDLPRVSFWELWNEPNYGGDLAPQANRNSTVLLAPAMYRSLLDAGWSALGTTGHGHDTIVIGNLDARGASGPPSKNAPQGYPGYFDATKPYWWPAVQWTGNYSGPANAAALNAATAFDTTGFANPIAGTFGWSFGADGRSLSLTYTPATVPEPGTLASAAIGGLAAGWAAQRRRRTT